MYISILFTPTGASNTCNLDRDFNIIGEWLLNLGLGMVLYRATPSVTRGPGFSGLIQVAPPLSTRSRQWY